MVGLPLLAASWLAVAADDVEVIEVPLRIHRLVSVERALDASMDDGEIAERVRAIQGIFAPAGIRWVVEVPEPEHPADEGPFRERLLGHKAPSALKALVTGSQRLSPAGLDLYVVRELKGLGFGGAYVCSTDGQPGHGAAFIAAQDGRGHDQAVRKWAHELGHALGLPHTPCDAASADRLMMSGKCDHAQPKRVRFTDDEIARMRAQARLGSPAPCRARHTEDPPD